MKKNFIIFFSLIVMSFMAFAKNRKNNTWDNHLSLGISFPIIFESIDMISETSNFEGHGYCFQLKDIIVHKHGLSFFVDMDIGTFLPNDPLDNEKGFFFGANWGVGYAPINKGGFLLAIGGIIGYDIDYISISGRVGGTHVEEEFFTYLFHLGADIFFSYKISNRVGLYIDTKFLYNIGASSILASVFTPYGRVSGDDIYLTYGCYIAPSAGISFRF